MITIEITRVEDVREGDVVTLTHLGHEFTGPAWWDFRRLRVGMASVDGPFVTFIRATRDLPDLPTEPGSVIVNATIGDVEGRTAVLDVFGSWFDPHTGRHCVSKTITAWTPARIVPES